MKVLFNVEMEYDMSVEELKEQIVSSISALKTAGFSEEMIKAYGLFCDDIPKTVIQNIKKTLGKIDEANKIIRVSDFTME